MQSSLDNIAGIYQNPITVIVGGAETPGATGGAM